MKKTLLATTIALSMVASFATQAASIDFQAIAAGNEYGASILNETADDGTTVTITAATITGEFPATTGTAYAYLDNGAGLGVCSVGLSTKGGKANQCTEPSDDNLTPGEKLTITFGTEINLTSMDFLDANHGTGWDADQHLHYTVDGGDQMALNLSSTVSMDETGTEFEFFLHEGQDLNSQFYIRTMDFDTVGTVSAVPVPAAVWLFGSGLVGLAGIARRKA